jgi:hypothetical protein
MDITDIIRQIKRNCDISDAHHWGFYSICGLLMRMRELFQHEHSLLPWDPVPSEDVSRWISEREALWYDLEGQTLNEIVVEGRRYDPFDVDGLNRLLEPLGYVYGSGFGTFNKPQFFLGRLHEKREIYDYVIHSVGTELCRDISLDPALLQGRCIYIRHDALVEIFWDRFQAMKSRQCGSLLEEVFCRFGIVKETEQSEDLFRSIEQIVHTASDLFVLHEIGEAFEDDYSEEWLGIIGSGCDKYGELYLRGTKDLIADTSVMGPLRTIVREQDENLLFLYVVLLDGIRKSLFPEITDSFREYRDTKQWQVIEEARKQGYKKSSDLRNMVIKNWREKSDTAGLSALLRKYVERGSR